VVLTPGSQPAGGAAAHVGFRQSGAGGLAAAHITRGRAGGERCAMTTKTNTEHLSLGALMTVLAITNLWFFTQVLGYVS
jgi:hypothetical protein